MFNGAQKAFPACVRGIRRGDVYYADFGSVEDAVGHELAQKRPVLIIQNNFGNKKSSITICLCFSTKCKYGLPYHVHFNDLNIVSRESDICAEQIKTIDRCRLEQYLGNAGNAVMEQVDKALVISLGIKGVDLSSDIAAVQEPEVVEEPQELISIFQYIGVRFIKCCVTSRLSEKLWSIERNKKSN